MKKVLLIEPNYKNKYPPIGLMKISTYHKRLGDQVRFFKGNPRDLLAEEMMEVLYEKLVFTDPDIKGHLKKSTLLRYIKTGRLKDLENLDLERFEFNLLLERSIRETRKEYSKREYPKYDVIHITTLFTFYWDITIKTIEFYKGLLSEDGKIFVGGVLASLLPEELEKETGIRSHEGLLDTPNLIDERSSAIIDELPLDYSILYEVDYSYPTGSAYFTFMTKGCTRKCSFCSVPILEPAYNPRVKGTTSKFYSIEKDFGEQQNLLLMDNNVLASPNFNEILDEIIEMGFKNGATFVEPNQLEIAHRNLKRHKVNTRPYKRRFINLINDFINSRLSKKEVIREQVVDILNKYRITNFLDTEMEAMINCFDELNEYYEKYRNKAPKRRYVDFNQGTDARYVTPEIMEKMSTIPIKPLRIAFDYLALKDKYINAVELAAKNGISELSNYILYNFKDKPNELYERLRINIELNERLGIKIFSFPMKYIPLFGEEAKNRLYVGKHWTKKYISSVQRVLNVTKGIVAPGKEFFLRAFGKDLNEFNKILLLPDHYILFRNHYGDMGAIEEWELLINRLIDEDSASVINNILDNDFDKKEDYNEVELQLIAHYQMTKSEKIEEEEYFSKLRRTTENMIRKDQFKELTLTYDFE